MKEQLSMSDLCPKRRLFVQEYLVDLNATQAAIRAGYAEGSASSTASRLMRDPRVSGAVDEALAERTNRIHLRQATVVAGLLAEASRDDPRSQHSARVKSWELLGRHLGMFTERIEVGGSLSIKTLMERLDGQIIEPPRLRTQSQGQVVAAE